MLDEVRRFILRERLLKPGEPAWVAVSGGVDSMVLLHVLREFGHACSVAHVDHGLRGTESDADREFVAGFCRDQDIPFHAVRVDPKARALESNVSMQMAGRELRYEWFAELWKEHPMPIATGHHADDAVETLFIHLLRGTGMQGWASIPPKNEAYVRPLLCVGRERIQAYAQENGLPFREDASNADPKYLRNRIRHELLPLLESIRPGARRTIAHSIEALRELEVAAQQQADRELNGLLPLRDGSLRVPFARIEGSSTPTFLLYRLLRPLGFHPHAMHRIREAIIQRSTGALFMAGNWRACVDRDTLMIVRAVGELSAYVIDPGYGAGFDGPFEWSMLERGSPVDPIDMNEAWLDADRLSFPVELRPWRVGDRMRPAGLGGSKLVSDILIDAKVPVSMKQRVYVLVNGEEIGWLVGHRLAEGYRATSASSRVLRIAHRSQPER